MADFPAGADVDGRYARLVAATLEAVERRDAGGLTALLAPLHAADNADLLEQIDPADRRALLALWSGLGRSGGLMLAHQPTDGEHAGAAVTSGTGHPADLAQGARAGVDGGRDRAVVDDVALADDHGSPSGQVGPRGGE